MKKNVIAIVAAIALVVLAVPTIAFANGMQQTWCPDDGSGSLAHHAMRAAGDSDAAATVGAAIATVRGEYVDRNSNGVCDNYGSGQGGCAGYVDADGDGVCDNCAANQGACPGYVDADNDGICDQYGTGAHHGCGNGCAYVDADNDGVCDNYGSGNGSGYVDADNDGVCDNYGSGNGYGRGNGNGNGHHGCMRR